ncbi:hypothetical protein M405DRAFT_825895 [Rhizopogon salebrosus TDB-379]|nr:hypothetical protein M405DRAFT_825895 [Rhizopogon salebrosus TDB-379]
MLLFVSVCHSELGVFRLRLSVTRVPGSSQIISQPHVAPLHIHHAGNTLISRNVLESPCANLSLSNVAIPLRLL